MVSEKLRELAKAVREKAAAEETEKMVKCGQVLQAARALDLLRQKVRAHVR